MLVSRERAPRFGSDVLRFGTAVLLVLALNVVQVFIVPRRLSVAAFGEYRVFLLYIGYLGVLHLGLVDGAFLRWVGRPRSLIRVEWPTVLRRLVLMQLPMLAVAGIAYAFASAGLTRIYVIAFALCAVASNLASFASFTLQAAGDFLGAGRVIALPSGLFALAVVAFPIGSLESILTVFVATTAIGAAVGLGRLAHVTGEASADEPLPELPPISFRAFIVSGLPVLGTGIAIGLSQFADRILVSLIVPVATFAFYGFASSTMALAGVARQTLGRVTLTHAARREGVERAHFFDGAYDLGAAAFGLALLGEPLFELVVERVLPRYVEALPIVRALIAGAPFSLGSAVVVLGVLQTYGFVRRQFAVSVLGAALVAIAAFVALMVHAPLWGVAAAGSAATALAWLLGVAITRRVVPEVRLASALRFLAITTTQCVALGVALAVSGNCAVRTLIYLGIAVLPTLAAIRAARAHWVL